LGSSYQEEEMVGIPLIGLTTYPFIPISGPWFPTSYIVVYDQWLKV
jgi:hypothetical protein